MLVLKGFVIFCDLCEHASKTALMQLKSQSCCDKERAEWNICK